MLFPGLLKFFPAASSRKVAPPLIGGEREPCVALNAGKFQDFRHFCEIFAAPRSRKVAFGKSLSRKVALPESHPPGTSLSRKVGFSRIFAAPPSRKVVLPESRVPGKSPSRKVAPPGNLRARKVAAAPPRKVPRPESRAFSNFRGPVFLESGPPGFFSWVSGFFCVFDVFCRFSAKIFAALPSGKSPLRKFARPESLPPEKPDSRFSQTYEVVARFRSFRGVSKFSGSFEVFADFGNL